MHRPLWTLQCSNSVLNKLKDAGYEYLEDVLCNANKEGILNYLFVGTDLVANRAFMLSYQY